LLQTCSGFGSDLLPVRIGIGSGSIRDRLRYEPSYPRVSEPFH
jgi:hypothetical protein